MFRRIRNCVFGALAGLAAVAGGGALNAQDIGPSTSTEPFVLPTADWTADQVKTISILTTGDGIDGYRMVGIPDGTGAFLNASDNHDSDEFQNSFTLLVNHELPSNRGAVRAHGSVGSFISKWNLNNTLEVTSGEDFTQSADDLYLWDRTLGKYVTGTTAWNRFCSADLPLQTALRHGSKGTNERIYLNGEEVNNGRAWAHIATGSYAGTTWELARMGKLAWENVLACPTSQDKTIVALMDDGELSTSPTPPNVPSDLVFYIGDKQKQGNPIERAGLTNGFVWGVNVTIEVDGVTHDVTEESNDFGLGGPVGSYVAKGRFTLVKLGEYSGAGESETTLQEDEISNDVLRMQRVEDGAWDIRRGKRGDFYFVTTASFTFNSRLWKVSFDDIVKPEKGGTIEILLKGDEGQHMFDNICIDSFGRILLQEDVGNNAHVGKIWIYDTADGDFAMIATHNEKFFTGSATTNPDFLTLDEESSGIIDARDVLGAGWYLFDVQNHKASSEEELVQGGQLLAMYVAPDLLNDKDNKNGDEDGE